MGRLFWKFFLCILLAQLAATIGVGAVFWLRDQARAQASGTAAIDTGPPAEYLLDAAAATLAHGGSAALRELVAAATRFNVFVIDESGHDMLGRTVAWYFSRPIRALRSAFEAASAGDLAPRFAAIEGVRGDELSDLGRDFDRMSARPQVPARPASTATASDWRSPAAWSTRTPAPSRPVTARAAGCASSLRCRLASRPEGGVQGRRNRGASKANLV